MRSWRCFSWGVGTENQAGGDGGRSGFGRWLTDAAEAEPGESLAQGSGPLERLLVFQGRRLAPMVTFLPRTLSAILHDYPLALSDDGPTILPLVAQLSVFR